MAHGELNRPAVKLAPVFYNCTSEIDEQQCWHQFITVARAIRQDDSICETEKTFSLSKHKLTETEILTSWDSKVVHTPIL